MRFFWVAIVGALALWPLAACGGSSTQETTLLSFGCPLVIPDEQLLYPAPGSTAIPAAVNTIVIAGPVAFLTLQPMTGTAIVTSTPTAVPIPIPSPNATPRTNPTGAFAVPALAAATTYTVTAQAPSAGPQSPGNCPAPPPQLIGSFTTQ
jgi:hypothetical protein